MGVNNFESESYEYAAIFFGGGLVIGKQFFITKHIIFDLNIGALYLYFKYLYYYEKFDSNDEIFYDNDGNPVYGKLVNKKPENFLSPKLGINFGYKF